MIELRKLFCKDKGAHIENLSIEIPDGQIYGLLCSEPGIRHLFPRLFSGSLKPVSGDILIDGSPPVKERRPESVVCLDRVTQVDGFDTEVIVKHWVDFLVSILRLSHKEFMEMLIKFNFPEEYGNKRLKDLDADLFRILFAAIQFTRPARNWLIHDFCKGVEKKFETKFNRLLMQKREQKNAVIYLTNDIFYVSEIADRVGFLKKGMLTFEVNADELKEMDFKELYLKFLS